MNQAIEFVYKHGFSMICGDETSHTNDKFVTELEDEKCVCCLKPIGSGYEFVRPRFTSADDFKGFKDGYPYICEQCAFAHSPAIRKNGDLLISEKESLSGYLFTKKAFEEGNVQHIEKLINGEFKAPFVLSLQRDVKEGKLFNYRQALSAQFLLAKARLTVDENFVCVNFTNAQHYVDIKLARTIYENIKTEISELKRKPLSVFGYLMSVLYGKSDTNISEIEQLNPAYIFIIDLMDKYDSYLRDLKKKEEEEGLSNG